MLITLSVRWLWTSRDVFVLIARPVLITALIRVPSPIRDTTTQDDRQASYSLIFIVIQKCAISLKSICTKYARWSFKQCQVGRAKNLVSLFCGSMSWNGRSPTSTSFEASWWLGSMNRWMNWVSGKTKWSQLWTQNSLYLTTLDPLCLQVTMIWRILLVYQFNSPNQSNIIFSLNEYILSTRTGLVLWGSWCTTNLGGPISVWLRRRPGSFYLP